MQLEAHQMAHNNRIEVLLIDDRPLVRAGVRRVVDAEPDLRVVGEAGSLREGVAMCRAHRPAVAVLNINVSAPALLRAVRELRDEIEDTPVVVVSRHDNDEDLFQAVAAGASGQLADASDPRLLALTVREAAAGREPITERVAARPAVSSRVLHTYRLLAQSAIGRPEGGATLGPRERQILSHVAQGMTNRQIGRELGLSENTVKAELSRIMRQLGLRGRTEAVVLAVRRGWIVVPVESARRPERDPTAAIG
jgi:two-component system, NarL family, response regulator DevR